jgi:hypothetical protein
MIVLFCDVFGQERPVRPAESSQWEGFGFVGLCMDDKFTVLHGMEHTAVVILYVLL